MDKVKFYSITQTETPPKHDTQYMCSSKMVKLTAPCMDLDWPEKLQFSVVMKSDYDEVVKQRDRVVDLLKSALTGGKVKAIQVNKLF